MKVSVSLPDEDVEFLDAYAQAEGLKSRSAVLHKAVRLLRGTKLDAAYEEAFQDWEETGEGSDWEVTANDGIGPDATR
jgi:Arc/MetJ-type ribon-helix-helix transcriptional regulator